MLWEEDGAESALTKFGENCVLAESILQEALFGQNFFELDVTGLRAFEIGNSSW